MNFSDFGLSILASYLANKLSPSTAESRATPRQDNALEVQLEDLTPKNAKPGENARFRTFDVLNDFSSLLDTITDPVIHILVEQDKSSAYHQLGVGT